MVFRARVAWSDGGRVVVVDPDPRVFAAINVALSPWSLRVLRVGGPLPQADVVAATGAAKALAELEHAGAVLWVAPPSGSQVLSLWLYDAQTAQLVVRPLTVAAPFDDAAAAAVALSVKTIMRGSPLLETSAAAPTASETTAAPAPSGSPAAPPPSPSPAATPPAASAAPAASEAKPPASAPAATASVNAAARPSPSAPSGVPSTARETASPSRSEAAVRWRLEIVGGARGPSVSTSSSSVSLSSLLEPQSGIGVSAWPSAWSGHFGVGAVAQFGLGTSVTKLLDSAETFQGQFVQGSLTVTARARTTAGPVGFEAQAGPAVRVTSLSGSLSNGANVQSQIDWASALDGAAAVDLALGSHLTLGVLVDVTELLPDQSYELNPTTPLFDQQTDLFAGARLSLEVD